VRSLTTAAEPPVGTIRVIKAMLHTMIDERTGIFYGWTDKMMDR
jgi:hypothetical protein